MGIVGVVVLGGSREMSEESVVRISMNGRRGQYGRFYVMDWHCIGQARFHDGHVSVSERRARSIECPGLTQSNSLF